MHQIGGGGQHHIRSIPFIEFSRLGRLPPARKAGMRPAPRLSRRAGCGLQREPRAGDGEAPGSAPFGILIPAPSRSPPPSRRRCLPPRPSASCDTPHCIQSLSIRWCRNVNTFSGFLLACQPTVNGMARICFLYVSLEPCDAFNDSHQWVMHDAPHSSCGGFRWTRHAAFNGTIRVLPHCHFLGLSIVHSRFGPHGR